MRFLAAILFAIFTVNAFAGDLPTTRVKGSVSIGASYATPDSKALLDMSSTTKGVLFPRMTTAQRTAIASPSNYLIVYDTDLKSLYQYNGTAWVAVGSSGGGLYSANVNVLSNTSWETDTSNWTASGGTYTRTTTAANVIPPGTGAASWDSSSASQTLTSNSQTITSGDGMSARSIAGSCAVKCASGTCTHKLQIYDGTNVLAESTITSTTSNYARTSVNAVAPTSGTVALRLISVASDEPTAYIDDCYLGLAENYNLYQTSQARLLGKIRMTGCTDWTRSNTSFGSFTATSGCSYTTYGDAQQPSTVIPAIKFNAIPPGYLYFVARGGFGKTVTNTNADVGFRFSDGTNTFGETIVAGAASSSGQSVDGGGVLTGSIQYTTAQGATTIEIQGKTSNTTSSTAALVSDDGGVNASSFISGLEIEVYFFPSQSEIGYKPDILPGSWFGYHDSTCTFTTSSTSFTDPADASCALVETQNNNFGTVSTTGSVNPGITFTPKRTGSFLVCGQSNIYNSGATAYTFVQLLNGSRVLGQTLGGKNAFASPVMLCGIVTATSTASTTVKFQIYTDNGATTAYLSSSTNINAIYWSIISLDQGITAPSYVGSVTSSSASSERVERAKLNCDSSSSITSQSTPTSGSNWVTSIGNISTGACAVVIDSSKWSAAPTCVTQINGCSAPSGAACFPFWTSVPTTSGFSIKAISDAGGLATAFDVDVICMGPK